MCMVIHTFHQDFRVRGNSCITDEVGAIPSCNWEQKEAYKDMMELQATLWTLLFTNYLQKNTQLEQ